MKPSEWEMRERLEGWTNNEEEWLACPVAHSLLYRVLTVNDLKLGKNERSLRLFGSACCRLVWPYLNSQSKAAIEAAEQYADGNISEQQLYEAKKPLDTWIQQTHQPGRNDRYRRLEYAQYSFAISALEISSAENEGGWPYIERITEMDALVRSTYGMLDMDEDTIEAALCERLRDIYGNPFRKVEIQPAWQTPSVLQLARSIYDNRTFEHLPRLADALEETGCDDFDLLQHCREKRQHVRGCWAIDCLLGWES